MSANSRRPFTSRLNFQPIENGWYLFLMLFLLLMFWVYARYIERVDVAMVTTWLNQTLPVLPEVPGLAWLLRFFHWRVLRHVIAVGVGWYFAYDAAVVLVKILYDLPDRAGARRFLRRLLGFSTASTKVPEITPATLGSQREESVLLRVGGPGQVKVPPGHVIVTELNGRFQRTLSAGTHRLGRYEYIHAVLNLQPQERTLEEFSAFSRDGIELRVGLGIVYRLKTGGEVATRQNPYPYDETAVRTAAYAQTVLDEKGNVATWEETPVNLARATLVGILARYKLDEIITPQRPAEEPYRTLRNQLLRQLRQRLDGLGIELLGANIQRIDLPPGVNDQYIDYWRSHWQSQMMLRVMDGEATAVEKREIARAQAEMTMVQAILEGVQRARREGVTAQMDEVVALRLVEALEMMARQSQQSIHLPPTLLPQLDELRQQLSDGTYDPKLPGKPML